MPLLPALLPQAARCTLMGRAVSVSQSLPGLRSCQSLPHGCCLMSGFASGAPTRPVIAVIGGSATSSAPAFPSSCAAADAKGLSYIKVVWLLLERYNRHINCSGQRFTKFIKLRNKYETHIYCNNGFDRHHSIWMQ